MPPTPTFVDRQVRVAAPPVVDRVALWLFGQYRLVMLAALATVYYLSDGQRNLGLHDPMVFELAHLGYVVTTLGFLLLLRLRRLASETQFYLESYADILFIALLVHASGGVQSGLGPLLLISMALLSHFAPPRRALLFGAISSSVVLVGELVVGIRTGAEATDLEQAALLCSLLFAIAWLTSVPLRRLTARQLTEPTSGRAPLDLHQVSELNEEIVRELDSGVLVIDAAREVLLVNDTARVFLAAEFIALPLPLARLSRPLLESLDDAERSSGPGAGSFTVESSGQSLLPQYIPLSNGGMLIKLDDHAHIRQQFQQLKLASLGRLSASVAHEIRTPLGAISHTVQLIEKGEGLGADETELLSIARRHTARIDRIVNDVLQLSDRRQLRGEAIDLGVAVTAFVERFEGENALAGDALVCEMEPELRAVVDPDHLDQMLWNLCTNARLQEGGDAVRILIRGFATRPGAVALEVTDDGAGIPDIDRERLFEPFYSAHLGGSGLRLYIIRELCELNRAEIECLRVERGTSFRLTLSTPRQMAA